MLGSPNGDDSVNDVFGIVVLAPGQNGIEYNFGEILDGGSLVLNATAYCDNNAARIDYDLPDFSGPGAGNPPPITLRFFTVADRLVEVLSDQLASGTLPRPGTALDSSDVGVAWPGWVAQGGGFVSQPPGTFDPNPLPVPALPFGLVWVLALLSGSYGLYGAGPSPRRMGRQR